MKEQTEKDLRQTKNSWKIKRVNIWAAKEKTKKAKAISVAKTISISRKGSFWTIKTKAGPHNKQSSIALGIIVRDFIKIAKTLKEKIFTKCKNTKNRKQPLHT